MKAILSSQFDKNGQSLSHSSIGITEWQLMLEKITWGKLAGITFYLCSRLFVAAIF